MADVTNIAGRINSISQEGVAVLASQTLDERKNKKQSVVNQETDEELANHGQRIGTLEQEVGSGGSVDERIAQAKSESESDIKGGASSDYDTLKKAEDAIKAEAAARQEADSSLDGRMRTLEDNSVRYTPQTPSQTEQAHARTNLDTYSKAEVNQIASAFTEQNYVSVQAVAATTAADIPTLINATGDGEQTDTLYRVGWFDGTAFDVTKYSLYTWNGTAYVQMAVCSSIGEVFDISVYNQSGGTPAQYETLALALGTDGANVPSGVRQGGMSVKFIQSNDNKYVQFRLMSDEFSTTVTDWQGVDDEPTAGSQNLVKSGGVAKVLNDTINPEKINLTVQSGGYYTVSSGQIVLQETEGNYYATYSVSEDGVYVVSGVNYRAREIIIENPDHTFEILPSTEVNTVPKHILVTLYAGQTLYISSLGDYISLYHIGSFNDYDVIIKKYIKNFTENVACIYKLRMPIDDFENGYYYLISRNSAIKHENKSYKTRKVEVLKGDVVHLTSNALPSSGLRTYTLTDKDYNIISESPVSTTYNNEAIPVTVNGYLFLNASVIDEVFSCIIERNMFNIDYDFETAIKKAFLNTIPSSEIGTDGTYFGTAGKVWKEDSRFTRYKAMNLQKGDVVSYDISMTNTTAPYFFKVDDDNNITDVILTLNGTSSASGEYTVLESGLYVFAIRSGSFSVLYCKYKQTEIFKQGEVESLKLITDGGYLGIFQRIGVIGDSLASGALSYGSPNTQGVDMYFYSWPQYIQRKLGNTVFNFSRGGLSTRSFFTTDNEYVRRFDTENCQCYFIALGHNDWNWCNANWESEGYNSLDECITAYIGSESDIDLSDYSNNADTYYGNYGKIIQMIKEKVPNAKIFPVVMKVNSKFGAFNAAVKRMAHLFDNIFIIDAAKWFPQIPDGHYTEGHGNAIGYSTYANEVATMANAIIDENRQYFKYTGLIGTEYASYIPASDNGSVPSD